MLNSTLWSYLFKGTVIVANMAGAGIAANNENKKLIL